MDSYLNWFMNFSPSIAVLITMLTLVLSFELLSFIIRHFRLRQKLRDIPAPKTYPFIGIAMQLLNVHPDGKNIKNQNKLYSVLKKKVFSTDMHHWFRELFNKFEEGIVLTWIGTQPIVHVYEPEFAEVIINLLCIKIVYYATSA